MIDYNELQHRRGLFDKEHQGIQNKLDTLPHHTEATSKQRRRIKYLLQRLDSVTKALTEIDAEVSQDIKDNPGPCAVDDYAW